MKKIENLNQQDFINEVEKYLTAKVNVNSCGSYEHKEITFVRSEDVSDSQQREYLQSVKVTVKVISKVCDYPIVLKYELLWDIDAECFSESHYINTES